MKKAVLFDLFGTLVPSPPLTEYRQMVNEVAAILDIPGDDFFGPWMSVNDQRLDGSFGNPDAEVRHVAAVLGKDPTESQIAACRKVRREAVAGWLSPKPEALDVLSGLAERGTRLALVSDCVFDVPANWPSTELARHFQATVFSCEHGIRKPDRRVYEMALAKLDVDASEALFVGDGGSNELHGARSAGIDAVHLSEPGEVEVLRVGVGEWDGPAISRLSDLDAFLRA